MRSFRFGILTCLRRRSCGCLNSAGEKSPKPRYCLALSVVLTRALPVLLVCLALPAIAQKEIVTVTDWRVNTGDNAAWARPDIDDSQWTKIPFGDLSSFKHPDGTHWYRASFPVPADFAGQELAVGMGTLEEVYDVYVEGVRVGRYGSWEPTPHDGAEVELENGLPLGISADATYIETEIKTDGTVTFVSDGVVEARDTKGELLAFERMAALIGKQAADIAGAAQTWGQEDDITVLTVARAAMREAVTA